MRIYTYVRTYVCTYVHRDSGLGEGQIELSKILGGSTTRECIGVQRLGGGGGGWDIIGNNAMWGRVGIIQYNAMWEGGYYTVGNNAMYVCTIQGG